MKKIFTVAVSAMLIFTMTVNCFAMELVKRGKRGNDVREIQEMLISQGYLDDRADGVFGRKTEQAVLAFQKDHELDETGIVGTGTYNALKKGAAE